jgi:hypothetical protein
VLDLDPDLGSGISDDEWELARETCIGSLVHVSRGQSELPVLPAAGDGVIGLVIVDGLLSREVALRDHYMLELLCRDDVLIPPLTSEPPPLGGSVRLTALTDVVLLALDKSFIVAAARWPSLLTSLHQRLETQRERLAVQGLTAHLARAEDRVLLALWNLSNSCGRVTPEGIVLPLSLTHDVLGRLAAARRPTVTLALRALEAAGCVRRRDDGTLVLTAAAERRVETMTATNDTAPVLGQSLMLHKLVHTAASETRALLGQAQQARRTPGRPRKR